MNVIPAIDLLGGQAVRLYEGKRDSATVHPDPPWELARAYAEDGARILHMVDLDGAFAGQRAQAKVMERVIEAFLSDQSPEAPREVRVGGGIRTLDDIREAMGAGVTRVVLGTAAARAPKTVLRACELWPDRIIVAVNAAHGQVRIEGWEQASHIGAIELALQAAIWGASRILYTDITRDGTKTGPNVEATAQLQRLVGRDTSVIASGGIGTLEHVRLLFRAGIHECVIGRALYDGSFRLREAMAVVGMVRC